MSVLHTIERVSLPDDRQEDLVGTDWHQGAIVRIYDALLDLAFVGGLPWHVGNQLTLVGWAPDGTVWRPCPDIMVHPVAGPAPRKEMSARDDGVPALVIEVASESTWRHDVDSIRGKAAGYLALGAPYYLVFDPTGAYLGVPCRGWLRTGAEVQEWRPSADGRHHCAALGISLRPDGVFLRVYDAAGYPIPWREERLREIAALRAEIERLRQRTGTQDLPPESDPDAGDR